MKLRIALITSLLWGLSLPAIPPPKEDKPIPKEDFQKEMAFKFRGKTQAVLGLPVLKAKVKPRKITVWEPHEKKELTFEAIPFNALLDKILGPQWRNEEELVFTCVDNYQPSIPVVRFKKEKAYLAFSRTDSKEFKITNTLQGNETVELGPYYLIWDNRKAPKKGMGASGWPYQVVGVEAIRFNDKFPQMSPGRASDTIALGFKAFRTHCLSCHTINGDGGTKGVELNYPVNVTEYYDPKFLKRWILDPPSIRWGTTMPALPQALNNRSAVADQILAYLKRMKSQKKKPK